MKRYIVPLIVLITITSTIIIYINFLNTSKYEDSKSNKNTSKIDFQNGIININSEDKMCTIDSDCVVFQSDCGDCSFDVVSKDKLSTYSDEKNKYCTKNKPKSYCDSDFTGTAKCINKICQISE